MVLDARKEFSEDAHQGLGWLAGIARVLGQVAVVRKRFVIMQKKKKTVRGKGDAEEEKICRVVVKDVGMTFLLVLLRRKLTRKSIGLT